MFGKQARKRIGLLASAVLVLALVTLACGETVSPTPEPPSTPYPTYTPYPTFTPEPTPTPTPTSTPTVTVQPVADTIRIAAFNIQIFGSSKRQDDYVMDILTRIAREFDVVLVQEIRDKRGETAPYYLQKINELEGLRYSYARSERLGRSTSKEAYAYFYNTETIDFIEGSDYVYDDVDDVFEREPYIASFRSGNFDFTLVGIHTKPDDAYSEIDNLAVVVDSVQSENPNEKDIIVMGDFNADGRYFDEDDIANPFQASGFYWVITNDMDTMTKTDYTYDRMVLMGATYSHEYVEGSAEVFYFDSAYGIDNETLVWEVSDHYPIYAEFETSLMDDD